MEPLDATFVDAFLKFLNDPKAERRRSERLFAKHPYVKDRLEVFKSATDQADFKTLRDDMEETTKEILQGTGPKLRTEISEALNRSQFDGLLLLGHTKDGEPVYKKVRIGCLVEYQPKGRSIRVSTYPAISGVQNACWYALMLISRETQRVKICPVCKRFFNTQTTGQIGYCKPGCAEKAERENKKARTHNLRNPDDPRTMPYPTIPKPRSPRS